MSDLSVRLAEVRRRVADAAALAGRDPHEVDLLVAVKTQSPDRARRVLDDGVQLLGHSRAQELEAIEPSLAGLPHTSHFIGHLQSNKAGKVLPLVSCVQSVGTRALAQRLDRIARAADRTLEVFIQVNTTAEASKGGVAPDDAQALATEVGALDNLRLRGLMTIGAHSPDERAVRASYDRLANLRAEILASGAPGTSSATELSMGMSTDLEIAIAAGATMVRVGSGVFGPRPPHLG